MRGEIVWRLFSLWKVVFFVGMARSWFDQSEQRWVWLNHTRNIDRFRNLWRLAGCWLRMYTVTFTLYLSFILDSKMASSFTAQREISIVSQLKAVIWNSYGMSTRSGVSGGDDHYFSRHFTPREIATILEDNKTCHFPRTNTITVYQNSYEMKLLVKLFPGAIKKIVWLQLDFRRYLYPYILWTRLVGYNPW